MTAARYRLWLAEQAYEDLTIRQAVADAGALDDNERWSRKARRFEVVR